MLKRAFDTMAVPELEAALGLARAEAAAADPDGRGHHRLARALEAMAIHHANRDEQDAAVALLQEGVAAVAVAIERTPASSPYQTTLGELYGQLAAYSGVVGRIRYGRLATTAYARALELDPRNALAHVGAGIGKLETPAMFGGSTQDALREFRLAQELDAGCDEAWIWEGIAQRRQGDTAAARAALQYALRVNPSSDHAKRELARLEQDFR
jgi:tetratricopeptide (TPR) repeat protein